MLSLAFMVLLSAPVLWAAGRAARALRLPVITGYLLAGIIAGPSALLNVAASDRQILSLVEQMSIALIAVAAGAELQVAELRRTRKQVLALTGSILLVTWAVVFPLALALGPYIFKAYALSRSQMIALASMAAVLMGSRSPAAALAVLRETNAKGPFAALTLAVIVVKDISVVVLFAFNLDYLRAVSPKAAEAVQAGGDTAGHVVSALSARSPLSALLLPLWHVFLGAIIGLLAAYPLDLVLTGAPSTTKKGGGIRVPRFMQGLAAGISWARSQARWRSFNAHGGGALASSGDAAPPYPSPTQRGNVAAASSSTALPISSNASGASTSAAGAGVLSGSLSHGPAAPAPSEVAEGVRLGLVPLYGLALWRIAAWMHAESLVACVVVGLVVSNRSERARAEMEHVFGQVLPVVFVAFFALMGAQQRLASLLGFSWVALLIYVFRLGAIWVGTYLGYEVGLAPPEHRKYAWMAYVTQAGLEMGLASTVGNEFGGWGRDFSTVMVATILLNLVTGSPFYKRSLALAGESQLVGKKFTSSNGLAQGERERLGVWRPGGAGHGGEILLDGSGAARISDPEDSGKDHMPLGHLLKTAEDMA